MRYVRKYFPLIAALGLAMAACGDDDTTNPASGELTETEATALAALLAADGFADSQSAGSTAAPGLSAAPFGPQPATRVVFTIEDETHPCRLSGTRTLNASLEIVAGEAESDPVKMTLEGSTVYDACGALLEHEDGTTRVTLDSPKPGISMAMSLLFDDEGPIGPQTIAYDGTFDWSTEDGRSGRCTIDYEVTIEPGETEDSGTIRVTGAVCGHSLNRTLEWS